MKEYELLNDFLLVQSEAKVCSVVLANISHCFIIQLGTWSSLLTRFQGFQDWNYEDDNIEE